MRGVTNTLGQKFRQIDTVIPRIFSATVISDLASPRETVVEFDTAAGVQVIAQSIVGRMPAGTRVKCLAYPPRGVLVFGITEITDNYTELFTVTTANWEKPAGLLGVSVVVQGAGGAGGGAAVTIAGEASAGGGGGGGAAAIVPWLPASLIPDTGTVTVGVGGTGVSAGTGNAGGSSNFLSLIAASGGTGGNAMAAGAPPSMDATPGDGSGTISLDPGIVGYAASGDDGFFPVAIGITAGDIRGGQGGGSHLAGAQRPSNANSTNGLTGNLYGGGGSGSSNGPTQAARAGGDGADGAIFVTYHFIGGR